MKIMEIPEPVFNFCRLLNYFNHESDHYVFGMLSNMSYKFNLYTTMSKLPMYQPSTYMNTHKGLCGGNIIPDGHTPMYYDCPACDGMGYLCGLIYEEENVCAGCNHLLMGGYDDSMCTGEHYSGKEINTLLHQSEKLSCNPMPCPICNGNKIIGLPTKMIWDEFQKYRDEFYDYEIMTEAWDILLEVGKEYEVKHG